MPVPTEIISDEIFHGNCLTYKTYFIPCTKVRIGKNVKIVLKIKLILSTALTAY